MDDIEIERKRIRMILEREIESYTLSSQRNAVHEAYDAAYSDDLMRQGVSNALFVLATEIGV